MGEIVKLYGETFEDLVTSLLSLLTQEQKNTVIKSMVTIYEDDEGEIGLYVNKYTDPAKLVGILECVKYTVLAAQYGSIYSKLE